jgi:hypothetical protein
MIVPIDLSSIFSSFLSHVQLNIEISSKKIQDKLIRLQVLSIKKMKYFLYLFARSRRTIQNLITKLDA